MWKLLTNWLLSMVNMARELQEHRASIRQVESRVRDLEEAIKLLAQEQRHARQLDSAEREKLLLLVKQELAAPKQLLSGRANKRGKPGR